MILKCLTHLPVHTKTRYSNWLMEQLLFLVDIFGRRDTGIGVSNGNISGEQRTPAPQISVRTTS